jgi:hypothetical protein
MDQIINNVPSIKVHIDFLEDQEHLKYRRKCMDSFNLPGLYYYTLQNNAGFLEPCLYDHNPAVCKCHLPLHHVGHDEKIWHADAIPKNGWTIKGFRKLQKKGAAVGVMTSGFVDSERGFGIPLTPAEILAINEIKEREGRVDELLDNDPGLLFFEYGVNREGYWNHDLFAKQIVSMLDSLEFMYSV